MQLSHLHGEVRDDKCGYLTAKITKIEKRPFEKNETKWSLVQREEVQVRNLFYNHDYQLSD